MVHDIRLLGERLFFGTVGVILIAYIAACQPTRDIEVTSRSTISGTVNGSAVEGKIMATFNTGRGGTSSCDFSELPMGFTPGTFGTHT